MSKPLWLLDVDGVLNAVVSEKAKPPKVWPADSWRDFLADATTSTYIPLIFRILVAEPVLDLVRRAHGEGLAEVRWLTTWEEHDLVLTELAPKLGLPEFPIAGRQAENLSPRYSDYSWWWKLPIVQRIHAEDPGRDILWTDDDLSSSRPANAWVKTRPKGQILGISPDSRIGLIPAHVTKITKWLEPPRA
jgi:hypothetical protein